MDLLEKIFDGPLPAKEAIASLDGVRMVGTVEVDLRGKKHHWSDGLYEFLDLTRGKETADEELFLSFVVEEDRPELRARIAESFDGLGADVYSLFRVRTGGKITRMLGVSEWTSGQSGKPESVCVTLLDVSELTKKKGAHYLENHQEYPMAHLSAKWLNRVFENKVAGIFILNKQGQFLRTNQTYQKLTGYSVEELKQLTFRDLTPWEEWAACKEKMDLLLCGEFESFSFQKHVLTKSKQLRWVEINCTVIDEERFYLLCFLTDIHEKKLTEEKFRASEEQLYQAQKIAKIGSWSVNLKTGEMIWSKGMYDLTEVPAGYPLTKASTLQLIHPEDRERFKKFMDETPELKDFEIRHVTSGGVKHVLINARVEYDDHGAPALYLGTSQDISERRFADKRLQLVQDTAKLGWWEANLLTGEDVWSDSMFEMLDLDKATTPACFESYLKTAHPEDQQKILRAVHDPEILKHGWHNEESRHRCPDGTYHYLMTSGQFVWDGDRPVRLIGTMMDISETKEMQTRIEEAQKIARLGWWEADLLTGKMNWSSSIFDMLELDPAEGPLPFPVYVERVHPEDRPWLCQDPRALKDGWKNVQLRYCRKSGGYIHTLSSGKVIFDGAIPVKMIGTNMDISSLKETQIKLEQAQKIAKVGWWEFDMTGQGHNWYSPEHMEIFGIRDAGELASFEDFYGFVHPDDLEAVQEVHQKAPGNRGWKDLVHRIISRSGEVRYITSSATIESIGDRPVRLFGSVYDITRLKEIERQLSENLVNLEAMLKSMDNLVLIVDDQLIFRQSFCNNADILGVDSDAVTGRPVAEVLEYFAPLLRENGFHEAMILQTYQRALAGETVDPILFCYAPAGKTAWWETRLNAFQGKDGKRWLSVVVNDITSRKNAEEELIRSVQKEKELSEMRAEFVSMASHQFRTPLTVIKANMQLLERSPYQDAVIQKVAQRLNTEVDRLVNLMEDIMVMGKVQSNSVEPNFRPVNVRLLLEKIKLEVESQQKDGRLLDIQISGKQQLVKLDEQFMEHALHNLIDNAFKYSADAPNPKAYVHFGVEKLQIRIVDQGIGIPEEDRSKLFHSFQRGSNSQHIQGTGLGLAVSREFVKLNQGSIYLNHRRKEGTEFCIDLPIQSGR